MIQTAHKPTFLWAHHVDDGISVCVKFTEARWRIFPIPQKTKRDYTKYLIRKKAFHWWDPLNREMINEAGSLVLERAWNQQKTKIWEESNEPARWTSSITES